MSSLLSWIDHDVKERDRMQRILALFRERETRDELGLGGVRDSIADLLFPGTSTIQTRLRYFLLIPWVYTTLESRGCAGERMRDEARRLELAIRDAAVEGEDHQGVVGIQAGEGLRRGPSSIYWAGLEVWGLRRFTGSEADYFGSLDAIYRRRQEARQHDEGDDSTDFVAWTWHPELPAPPAEFPKGVDMRVSREEAEFLRDQIVIHCKGSLLAELASRAENPIPEIKFPWENPDLASLSETNQEILEQARLFSSVMNGASLLYNLMLAELAEKASKTAEYAALLDEWAHRVDERGVRNWDLHNLWSVANREGYVISPRTQNFVSAWLGEVRSDAAGVRSRSSAKTLIRERETRLKGSHSRFTNPRALDQWGGSSGVGAIEYRWGAARRHLEDLHRALSQGGAG